MIKPILNLDEVTFDDIEDNGYFTSKREQISDQRPLHNCSERPKFASRSAPVQLYSEHRRSKIRPRSKLCRGLYHIGAKKTGLNLTILPPGKSHCPFHIHPGAKEMFLILEGEGELRFGEQRHAIRKNDVIACPPGGTEVAHQIINTGTAEMRYLALSTVVELESCEYPDSNKIMIRSGARGEDGLWKMFRSESAVDYYDRESNEAPNSNGSP